MKSYLTRWGRPLVGLSAGLFCISTLFPIIASLIPAASLPVWMGYLDVILAFGLVIVAMLMAVPMESEISSQAIQASYHVYRAGATVLVVLLVVFFVFGDQINWDVLLPGLAWRAWLLIYVLQAGLTILEMGKAVKSQEVSA